MTSKIVHRGGVNHIYYYPFELKESDDNKLYFCVVEGKYGYPSEIYGIALINPNIHATSFFEIRNISTTNGGTWTNNIRYYPKSSFPYITGLNTSGFFATADSLSCFVFLIGNDIETYNNGPLASIKSFFEISFENLTDGSLPIIFSASNNPYIYLDYVEWRLA